MKYLTIQKIQFVGDLTDFDERTDRVMDALLEQGDANAAIEDPDLAADLTDGRIDVQMVIDADDPVQAMRIAQCGLRTALHVIGDATPGWETSLAVMHVAPVDASERLFADA